MRQLKTMSVSKPRNFNLYRYKWSSPAQTTEVYGLQFYNSSDFFTFGSSTKCTLPSLVDNLSNDIQEIKLPIYEKDGKLPTQILFNSIARAVIDKVEGCEDVLTEDYICFLLE